MDRFAETKRMMSAKVEEFRTAYAHRRFSDIFRSEPLSDIQLKQLSDEELMNYAEQILGPVLSSLASTTLPLATETHHPIPIPHPYLIDFRQYCIFDYEFRSLPMALNFYLEQLDLVTFYEMHDRTLFVQTKCLMLFEQAYVYQLVAIIWTRLCLRLVKRAGGLEEAAVESSQAISNELERMGFYCELEESVLRLVKDYSYRDPTLTIQTENLMLFERSYVLQLVAMIFGTLTRTSRGAVTSERRTIVNVSWEILCRLGIKLPMLEKLVATSQEPILVDESFKDIKEVAKSWRAISDEVDGMRKILASKEKELHNKYNSEEGEASIEIPSSQRQLLDEVGHMRRLVASKEEELQNTVEVFHEKLFRCGEFRSMNWCSFP
ncbi:hypothetical protein TorRG33x02_019820 [Trema orientale]|uniref:Uncharacterized protein n=1 Tax=Trema orientale TaxID=63057 RepID=A0A2P5FWN8_TREOI|nr:hypothetical protein TorRG33x02_019820 [Trema orientale]